MIDLSVTVAGVRFANPVIAASGTAAFGQELDAIFGLEKLGGIALKAVTLEPRQGNPPPRVAETPSGMLNAVGLQNPGLEAFASTELPRLQGKNTVRIANIAGTTLEDYTQLAARMNHLPVDMVELNISCPNVKAGGVAFGVQPDMVLQITQAVKNVLPNKPLIVKLTPNTASISETAVAAQQGGADAVSLINTLTGMVIDVHTRRPILANTTGGLSGPAIRPVALRMVWEAARAVQIPIIGMGGITTGEDVIAFMLAGACAVQVGTAILCDPYCVPRIVEEIEAYCVRHGVRHVADLIGALETA